MSYVKRVLAATVTVLGAVLLIFFISRKLNNAKVKQLLSA